MKIIYCENIIDGKRYNKPREVKKMARRTKIRKKLNAAAKKRGSPKNKNKSPNKRTKCICPTCRETHYLSLNLHPDERKKTDAGILYRRRCRPCKALVDRDGISSVAGAHNVGR